MTTELERTRKALDYALQVLHTCARHMETPNYADSVIKDIAVTEAILNPPPKMEEFETSAFRCPSCMRLHETDTNDCPCGKYCSQFAKLTGTVRREKVAPVERSVTVRAEVYGEDMEKSKGDVIGLGTPNSYPFQGYPECWGKVGVLTFTWQEAPPK
jgi:hypothetical protein